MKRSQTKSTEKKKAYSNTQKMVSTPNKKRKSGNYTQGDVPESIDDILMDITLKKPKRAYNFFISEMMEKDKNCINITDAAKVYSKKWSKMSSSEKQKYEDMAEEDAKRYNHHLSLVKSHILQKPLKEEATSYRIYLDEQVRKAIENNEDPKEAKKKASADWKNFTAEEKREWNEKKKEHLEWYENLKRSKGVANAYSLFVRDQMAAAREKGDSISMKECAEKWNKAKNSVKEKYHQYAEEDKEERMKNRDMYEIAFGLKPRKPHGAFKFFLMQAAKEGKLDKGNPLVEGHKLWKKLNEEQKEVYQRMAQKDKLAYLVKKMEYDATVRKTSSVRPMSAVNCFMADMKDRVSPSEYGKDGFFNYCYKKWRKLDDSLKRKYYQKAEASKQEAKEIREELKARVYDMPKRPGSSYNIFIKENYEKVKEDNPKKETSEIFGLCADLWNSLPDKQKAKYSKIHEKELENYKELLSEWNEKGFYTPGKSEGKGKRSQKARSSSAGKSKKSKKSMKE